MRRLLLLGLLGGCVTDPEIGEITSEIISGSPASTFQLQRAVKVYGCTATRISPRFAITAAHCWPEVGDTVRFYSTGPSYDSTQTATIAEVITRPGVYTSACQIIQTCDDDEGLFADVALVRLTSDAASDNAMTGMQATLAWKYPGEGAMGQKVGAGKHGGVNNPSGVLLQATDTTQSSSDVDGELWTYTHQVNEGDSGGPFYVDGRVLGVLYGSGWDPETGHYNNYTSVSRHLDWILTTIGYRWSGQPRQPGTTFTGSVLEAFAGSSEQRCQYACEKTSTCEAYAHRSSSSVCHLITNVTAVVANSNWNGALKHGASSGNSAHVAGYVRADGANAVVHEATNGDVHELRLAAQWFASTLSTNAPAGKLSAYRRSDGIDCVVYRATNGAIIELSRSSSVWTANALTGTNAAIGDPTAYIRSDGVNAIVFRSPDHHIRELRLGTTGWIALDLSVAVGGQTTSSDPSAYTRADGYSAVVFRSGTDIFEMYKAPGGTWAIANLSDLTNAPSAAGRPYGYTRSNGMNAIVYRSGGHIVELVLANGAWSAADLSVIAGNGSTAVGDPIAYVRNDGVESVVFRTSSGAIHELALKSTWSSYNLTSAAAGSPATSDPSVFVRADGKNAVLHSIAGNHVMQLALPRGGAWSAYDLTSASGEIP